MKKKKMLLVHDDLTSFSFQILVDFLFVPYPLEQQLSQFGDHAPYDIADELLPHVQLHVF